MSEPLHRLDRFCFVWFKVKLGRRLLFRLAGMLALILFGSVFSSICFGRVLRCEDLLSRAARQAASPVKWTPPLEGVDDISLTSKKDMVFVAQSVFRTIEINYGPLGLKKKTIGLEWEKLKRRVIADISEIDTERDLLYRISELLYSFNDGHASVTLPSSLTWTLPLQVSYLADANTYVLNFIDARFAKRNLVSGSLPELGAILISINGKSPDEFRKSIPAMNSHGNDLTNRSMFGFRLFSLSEKAGVPLSHFKNDGWDFVFESRDSHGVLTRSTARLKYSENGGGIVDINTLLPQTRKPIQNRQKEVIPTPVLRPVEGLVETLLQRLSGVFNCGDRQDFLGDSRDHSWRMQVGQRFGLGEIKPVFKLPADFQPIEVPSSLESLLATSKIFAGTFVKNGKKVGLLRIPTYLVQNTISTPLLIDFLLRRLEMSSDYLILDQMNNPGGLAVYSDFWIEALVGKYDPKKHVQFRVKPTSEFLTRFRDLIESFDQAASQLLEAEKRPLLNSLREQFEIVHRAYIAKEPLSEPVSMLPFSQFLKLMFEMGRVDIGPTQMDLFDDHGNRGLRSTQKYTKPIYMLINEMDFSAGDMTPAGLQDYGRAKLIGTRTAGAGGTVSEFSNKLMSAHFSYKLTTSLMYRPANPLSPYVENYGVTPDINFPPTAEDYKTGFSNYLNRLTTVIEKDLESSVGHN